MNITHIFFRLQIRIWILLVRKIHDYILIFEYSLRSGGFSKNPKLKFNFHRGFPSHILHRSTLTGYCAVVYWIYLESTHTPPLTSPSSFPHPFTHPSSTCWENIHLFEITIYYINMYKYIPRQGIPVNQPCLWQLHPIDILTCWPNPHLHAVTMYAEKKSFIMYSISLLAGKALFKRLVRKITTYIMNGLANSTASSILGLLNIWNRERQVLFIIPVC